MNRIIRGKERGKYEETDKVYLYMKHDIVNIIRGNGNINSLPVIKINEEELLQQLKAKYHNRFFLIHDHVQQSVGFGRSGLFSEITGSP